MNVFDFALKMEEDGKKFYEKLAAEAILPGLKRIFMMLAEIEQKHHDVFQALKNGTPPEMAESKAVEAAKSIFPELMRDKGTLKTIKSDLDAYRYALKAEADSVRQYEELAGKEQDPALRKLFLQLAEEEKEHYNIIENLCDFVAAPETFLAWGEFSNLKEL